MKRILSFIAFAAMLYGQTSIPWRASVTTTLTASGSYSFTVQQNGTNIQNLQQAVISCGTNTFTVAQSQNGVAATATQLTQTISGTVAASSNALVVMSPAPLNTQLTVTAWTASNVGTGTAVSGVIPYSSVAVIGLGGRALASTSTAQNYTFTIVNTGAASCSLVIDVYGAQIQ